MAQLITKALEKLILGTGFINIGLGEIVMLIISFTLIYLAIVKKYEPLLLLPIGFGAMLTNLPLTGIMDPGGLLFHLYQGINLVIFPPLIFLGIGAMTDFGPLIANPRTLLLGAAAQFGIFATFLGALFLGFTPGEAGAIAIIGGADGPTAIFLASQLAPEL
ncbi:MAG: sodium ion-translocating decarboxylase subunit beta, partial [Clostridia bacterium]|nr:sodium ion-translocating decarboxylase subunit beta [Clostridia bacterium]